MPQDSDRIEKRFRNRADREKRYKDQLPTDDDLPPPVEPIKSDTKPKRNDPCPCGSGKKYKQCCAKTA